MKIKDIKVGEAYYRKATKWNRLEHQRPMIVRAIRNGRVIVDSLGYDGEWETKYAELLEEADNAGNSTPAWQARRILKTAGVTPAQVGFTKAEGDRIMAERRADIERRKAESERLKAENADELARVTELADCLNELLGTRLLEVRPDSHSGKPRAKVNQFANGDLVLAELEALIGGECA